MTLEARGTRTTKSYTISVSLDSSAAGRGSVSGGGSYNYGTTATVVCTKTNSQDVFDGWYEGSTRVSTSLSYAFTVTGARTLVAKILYLDVTPTSLSYGATGGSQTFKITTNTTLEDFLMSLGRGFGSCPSSKRFVIIDVLEKFYTFIPK